MNIAAIDWLANEEANAEADCFPDLDDEATISAGLALLVRAGVDVDLVDEFQERIKADLGGAS